MAPMAMLFGNTGRILLRPPRRPKGDNMQRREFIGTLGSGTVAPASPLLVRGLPKMPAYLQGYEKLYARDPRAAAV